MLSRNAPTVPIRFLPTLLLALIPFLGGCGGSGDGASEADGSEGGTTGAGPAGQTGAAAPSGATTLTLAAQAEVTVDAMNVELDSIVQYDRLSGDPGEIAAVNYLVRTLKEEGIQVKVDTFLAFISDPVSAKVEVLGTDFAPEAITISGSGVVENMERPLVDLGDLNDLPPFLIGTGERMVLEAQGPTGSQEIPDLPNLQGSYAVVTGQPRPGPVAQISQMGAQGIIFINPEERLNDLTTTTVWGTPSLRSYHRVPMLPVAEIKRSDGDRLRAMMAEGTVRLNLSTETRTGWKPLHLAVATIPGPTPGAPYILAGGHLDSWHYGGTDNAGANVAMLELARAFSRNQDQLLRGLVIAWWPGHSNGRYAGSTWFVDQTFDELRRRALAYVNFEGLGQIDAKRFGASATTSFSDLAQSVVMEGTGETIDPRPPGRNSDQSFNGVGLPLLQLNHSRLAEDGGYWWWHTPDDTRDKVDAQVLKVDTDLYAATLARLLAEPTYPVNLSAPVERLGSILTDRQEVAGSHFDLSEALARQDKLLGTVLQVEAALGSGDDSAFDLELVAILRPVHRILYTLLGSYHPDPAESLGPLPGLNPVEILASNDPSTSLYQMALATLQREHARILEALDVAQAEAERVLEMVGGE